MAADAAARVRLADRNLDRGDAFAPGGRGSAGERIGDGDADGRAARRDRIDQTSKQHLSEQPHGDPVAPKRKQST